MKTKPQKRFSDRLPHLTRYSLLRGPGVLVRCPRCGGDAVLKNEDGGCALRCNQCHLSQRRSLQRPVYAAKGMCRSCERWMRVPLGPMNAHAGMARVQCPYCGQAQEAYVDCVGAQGVDPMQGLELYFRAAYRGHAVWALNREHLNYLIDYIGAQLREKPLYADASGQLHGCMQGQSQYLPRFMKQAKNRAGLLKVLTRMRDGKG